MIITYGPVCLSISFGLPVVLSASSVFLIEHVPSLLLVLVFSTRYHQRYQCWQSVKSIFAAVEVRQRPLNS